MSTEKTEDRLSSLESHSARTAANLEAVSADLGRLAHSVESLRETVSQNGRTQWNVLGTWVGVLMAIGAAVIAPQYADINALEQRVAEQSKVIHENAVQLGRLEEREVGANSTIQYQTQRTREEIDWVWDLLHSRFGYRDPERQRTNPNKDQ